MPEHELQQKLLLNGVLGAIPDHKFIKGWLDIIANNCKNNTIEVKNILKTTGPSAFWDYYISVPDKPPLVDHCKLILYTNKSNISTNCKSNISPFSYTLWVEGSNWGIQNNYISIIGTIFIIISMLLLIILLFNYK